MALARRRRVCCPSNLKQGVGRRVFGFVQASEHPQSQRAGASVQHRCSAIGAGSAAPHSPASDNKKSNLAASAKGVGMINPILARKRPRYLPCNAAPATYFASALTSSSVGAVNHPCSLAFSLLRRSVCRHVCAQAARPASSRLFLIHIIYITHSPH